MSLETGTALSPAQLLEVHKFPTMTRCQRHNNRAVSSIEEVQEATTNGAHF